MWPSEAQAKKDQFVNEWLKRGDPFQAALSIVGTSNAGKALQMADEWPRDPYIIAKRSALLAEKGEESFLPTKAEIGRKILTVAEEAQSKDDKIKALRLYSELMGFIVKDGGKNTNVSGNITVKLDEGDKKL